MRRKTCLACGLMVAGGTFLFLLVVLFIGMIYYSEYQTSARQVEGPRISAVLPEAYSFSSAQQAQITEAGYPESFLLLFYEEEQEDGSTGSVRYEVWEYYTLDTQVIFVNGELAGEQVLEAGEARPLPTNYRPDQFLAYMSLDEVVAAAQLQRYLVMPLEKALLPEGEIYFAGGLAFGLKENRLLYIETFIGEEGE